METINGGKLPFINLEWWECPHRLSEAQRKQVSEMYEQAKPVLRNAKLKGVVIFSGTGSDEYSGITKL